MVRLPAQARRVPLAVLALALAPACHLVGADVWNLRQVHDEDGSPSRTGIVRSDLEYLLSSLLDTLRFQDPELLKSEPKTIDDPLGVCLEALLGLKDGDSDDPRVRALQVELFAWLAVEDTYVLSRERCALQLGDLGRRLGVEGPMPQVAEPATPAQVAGALTELIRAVRPYLVGGELASGDALRAACERVAALPLDLDGARRTLRALSTLLELGSFERPELAPVHELLDDVERRCVRFAMESVLDDPEPIVRAAGVEAGVVMTGNRSPGLLRSALADRSEEVRLRALRLIQLLGLPQPPEPLSADEAVAYQATWIQLLVDVLRAAFEGPVSVGACQALARVGDAPFEDLRPEVWIAWWDEEKRLRAEATGAPADGVPPPPAGSDG